MSTGPDHIPSALERAMERVEKLGKASPEEMKREQLLEEGQKLAAQYMRGEITLRAELNKYDDATRKIISEGAQEILIRNLDLPRNDMVNRQNRTAMEGIKLLKNDKAWVENVFSKMRQIFEHYTGQGARQRQQVREEIKREFTAKLRQAVQQQAGVAMDVGNVEGHPQFQAELRRATAQLDSQYLMLLKEYKEELSQIP